MVGEGGSVLNHLLSLTYPHFFVEELLAAYG